MRGLSPYGLELFALIIARHPTRAAWSYDRSATRRQSSRLADAADSLPERNRAAAGHRNDRFPSRARPRPRHRKSDEGVASASTGGRALGRGCNRRGRRPRTREMGEPRKQSLIPGRPIARAESETAGCHDALAASPRGDRPAHRNARTDRRGAVRHRLREDRRGAHPASLPLSQPWRSRPSSRRLKTPATWWCGSCPGKPALAGRQPAPRRSARR